MGAAIGATTRGCLAALAIIGLQELHYLVPPGGFRAFVERAGCDTEEEELFTGTAPSRWPMAPWARWNRIYAKSPGKPTGALMLRHE